MPVKIRRPEFVAALASTATSADDDDKILRGANPADWRN
jgi:hypothetical protein